MEEPAQLQDDELLALLQPFFEVLASEASRVSLPDREPWSCKSSQDIFWLRHQSYQDLPGTLQQTEALELLVLLSRVDWQLWIQAMKVLWPSTSCEWEEAFESQQMQVGVEWIWSSYGLDQVFTTLSTAYKLFPHSSAFLHTQEILGNRIEACGASSTPIPVRVRIQVPGAEASRYLLVLFSQLNTHSLGQDVVPNDVGGLRLHELVWDSAATRLDHHLLRCLHVVSAAGVRVFRLPRIDPVVFRELPELFVRSVWQFYGLSTVDEGSDTVVLSSSEQEGVLPALCLALRGSPTVRSVVIPDEHSMRPSKKLLCQNWQWLAYALFSREVGERQRLQEATINVNELRSHVVAAMANVLTTRDPLMELLGDCNPSSVIQTIVASQFLLNDPSISQTPYISDELLRDLRVVAHSSDWTCVILPAWGPAWVHHDNVVSSETHEAHATAIQSIASMNLTRMTKASRTATLDLLKLVGYATRRLRVEADYSDQVKPLDGWCRQLLAACPMLKDLELCSYPLDSLQVFLDGYVSGTCHLQRLVLWLRLSDADTSLMELLSALSEKRHAVSRCLHDFICQVSAADNDGSLIQAVFPTALQMLQQNQRLLYLKMSIYHKSLPLETMRQYVVTLRELDRTQVVGHSSPQEIRRKLAFLSVVIGRSKSALSKLDVVLLALIFRLTATKRTRRVFTAVNGYTLNSYGMWINNEAWQ